MLDLLKQSLHRQYEAALQMLSLSVDQCPAQRWDEPVANLRYCQAVFHALFFADLYLGPDVPSIRQQPFHREHAAAFADYEELESRRQVLTYTRAFIADYFGHCRAKAAATIAAETESSLARITGFDWLKFPRAELHVYNIRHIHHHAAQLSLCLRLNTGEGVRWVRSGWQAT